MDVPPSIGLGSAVSSPSRVWGRAPAEIEFCALGPLKLTSGGIKFTDFLRINWPQCVKSTAKFGGLATIRRGLCPPPGLSVEPPLQVAALLTEKVHIAAATYRIRLRISQHAKYSLYFTMGGKFPGRKIPFLCGAESGLPSNTWFLWLTRLHTQMAPRSVQPCL